MLGFSTNWFPEDIGLAEFKEFVNASGINSFELSYRATPSFIEMICEQVSQGSIKILSVHDVCPRPKGYKVESLSSLDEDERLRAVKFTAERSVETASKVKGDRIVLHLGEVEMQRSTLEMISVFSGESQESFKKYKKEFQAERKRKAPAHFAQARKSLTELIDCIGSRRIRLAVENRFWYEEFPDFGEIGALLNAFDPDKVSYWHDTSHAQAMETLEFCDQRAYLDAYGERLAGFHIGDMSFDERLNSGWLKDYAEFKTEHKSPGYGNIDFSFLRDFSQRKDIRFIFELYKSVDFSQIVSGKSRIEKILA